LVELLRLWGPLVLGQVTPRLAPELQSLLGHALQQSVREVPGGVMLPSGLSRQLASGMVESLMDLSRGTAQRLARSDDRQVELLQRFGDRFWEELATALEQGGRLERSQQLFCALLQQIKRNYLAQINRAGVDALMEELDELMAPPGPPATPPA
jgi:glycine/D-amino acid oxidase-like deaminating enzyme